MVVRLLIVTFCLLFTGCEKYYFFKREKIRAVINGEGYYWLNRLSEPMGFKNIYQGCYAVQWSNQETHFIFAHKKPDKVDFNVGGEIRIIDYAGPGIYEIQRVDVGYDGQGYRAVNTGFIEVVKEISDTSSREIFLSGNFEFTAPSVGDPAVGYPAELVFTNGTFPDLELVEGGW